MVRGIERRAIFLDDTDRRGLLEHLCEVVPDCGARVFAWAFMDNHLHVVVRSGEVRLSRLMGRINTGHAVRFNRRHERAGYLFQGRFRSRVVQDSDDLRHLVRYVHLNPVEAGIVRDLQCLDDWRWCGHGALTGARSPLAFEDCSSVWSMFDSDLRIARSRLAEWMRAGLDPESGVPAERGVEQPGEPVPPATDLDVGCRIEADLETLIDCVCRYFATSNQDLLRGARDHRTSSARALVCHVAVVQWRLETSAVARRVGVSPAAASQALIRGRALARDHLARLGLPVRIVS